LDKVEQLAGKFNAAISGKIIVFADEAFFAGDKREVGALKRLITEPSLHIERKGIDGVDEDNHVHLFMATNERWSWPAALDDRRGFLLKVSDAKAGDHAYFKAIMDELNAGGRRALLKHLLDRDVDWDALQHAPKTAERRAQQNISMDGHLSWWMECLHLGEIGTLGWPAFAPTKVLHVLYSDWCRPNRRRVISIVEFGQVMNKFFSVHKSRSQRSGRDKARGYDLRPLQDARDYFDSVLESKVEWPEVEESLPSTNF
jgi:phage/plasmid-associated DNA primase